MKTELEQVEPPVELPVSFEDKLCNLINQYSRENGSDTPDFILASYLEGCLLNFNKTLQSRTKFYTFNEG